MGLPLGSSLARNNCARSDCANFLKLLQTVPGNAARPFNMMLENVQEAAT